MSAFHSVPLRPAASAKQVVVVEAEERALQHLGQRQVVLGQRQEIAERDQILDRDLLGEAQAVGAGDRNAARLQRRHHRRRERAALAHQDEDVAGRIGAALGGEHARRCRASR